MDLYFFTMSGLGKLRWKYEIHTLGIDMHLLSIILGVRQGHLSVYQKVLL
jgi:hypothetical protein